MTTALVPGIGRVPRVPRAVFFGGGHTTLALLLLLFVVVVMISAWRQR